MTDAGSALMGIGRGVGEGRALTAAKAAIESPLLEISINGARGILFNITGGQDMTMSEVNEAAQIISQAADPDANIIFGAAIDETMGDEVKISVIATGFDENYSGAKLYGTTLTRSMNTGIYQPAAPISTPISTPTDAPTTTTSPTPPPPPEPAPITDVVEDEFDIPAFLRRK